MPTYTDLVASGNTQTVTSETAIDTSGGAASPYTPVISATLVSVIATCVQGGTAVRNTGYLRLKCPTFGGVDHIVPILPIGVNVTASTAAFTSPNWGSITNASSIVNLPVSAGVGIAILIKFNAAPSAPLTDILFVLQR